MAYDLIANTTKRHTGKRTGAVFLYKNPGTAFRNHITELLTANGVPDDINAETVQHISQIRIAALRCCLLSIEDFTVNGEPYMFKTVRQNIGGITLSVLSDETLETLAEGDLGADMLDVADAIVNKMEAAPDEKNEQSGQ